MNNLLGLAGLAAGGFLLWRVLRGGGDGAGKYINIDGTQVYVIEPKTQPRVLVLLHHGSGGTGGKFAATTQISRYVDDYGLLVAAPDGVGITRENVAQVEQLTQHRFKVEHALVANAAQRGARRVILAGFSGGAAYVHTLITAYPDIAFGIMLAAGSTHTWPQHGPPIDIVWYQSMRDFRHKFQGGRNPLTDNPAETMVLPFADRVRPWLAYNDAGPGRVVQIPGAPRTVTTTVYQGPQARVITLIDREGTHEWPAWYTPVALRALLGT